MKLIENLLKTNASTLQDASGQASSVRSWKFLAIVTAFALIAVDGILLLKTMQPSQVAQVPQPTPVPSPQPQATNNQQSAISN